MWPMDKLISSCHEHKKGHPSSSLYVQGICRESVALCNLTRSQPRLVGIKSYAMSWLETVQAPPVPSASNESPPTPVTFTAPSTMQPTQARYYVRFQSSYSHDPLRSCYTQGRITRTGTIVPLSLHPSNPYAGQGL